MLKSKSSRKEQISVKLALEKSNTYRGLGFEVEGGQQGISKEIMK